jgi:hypothetical protein
MARVLLCVGVATSCGIVMTSVKPLQYAADGLNRKRPAGYVDARLATPGIGSSSWRRVPKLVEWSH